MPIYTRQVCIRGYSMIQSRVKFWPSIQAYWVDYERERVTVEDMIDGGSG